MCCRVRENICTIDTVLMVGIRIPLREYNNAFYVCVFVYIYIYIYIYNLSSPCQPLIPQLPSSDTEDVGMK